MFAVEVNFLTGRFTATAHHDRGRAEWPPHPARLFSALVATWADSDQPDPAERAALEWLERQEPPSISAPPADVRKAVVHFVPVNDAAVISPSAYIKRSEKIDELLREQEELLAESQGEVTRRVQTLRNQTAKQRDVTSLVSPAGSANPKDGRALFPEGRNRQARQWPSVTPRRPRVVFSWQATPDDAIRDALDGLLSRVTRLGHSSSLVSCRVASEAPAPSHLPDARGEVMRAVGKGQLAALESEYARHLGSKPRSLPYAAVRYLAVDEEQPRRPAALRPNTVGEWLLFEFVPASRKFPSTRAVEIAIAMRASLFKYAPDPLPEGLTGHRADGSPSPDPHAAVLPLPYVGYEHADGRLLGLAVSIPESSDDAVKRSILRAIGEWERAVGGDDIRRGSPPPLRLTFGKKGTLEIIRAVKPSAITTLKKRTWIWPSRRWVSATPIALPANPGHFGKGSAAARAKVWAKAEEAVLSACRHIGLPEPEEATLSLTPFLAGARPAPDFPPFRQGRGDKSVSRRLVHASLLFAEPVAGPLMLGSGRFLGLGLMRPVAVEKSDHA